MATYTKVKALLLRKADVSNHFAFWGLDEKRREICQQLWEEINREEFQKGYKPGEYEKAGTSALCEMDLLTPEELEQWKKRIEDAW